ncbi:hypothetical protein [Pseudonocardia spinosispora]|nr:hypothetical protein [Pseudonocardia spinosispora]
MTRPHRTILLGVAFSLGLAGVLTPVRRARTRLGNRVLELACG